MTQRMWHHRCLYWIAWESQLNDPGDGNSCEGGKSNILHLFSTSAVASYVFWITWNRVVPNFTVRVQSCIDYTWLEVSLQVVVHVPFLTWFPRTCLLLLEFRSLACSIIHTFPLTSFAMSHKVKLWDSHSFDRSMTVWLYESTENWYFSHEPVQVCNSHAWYYYKGKQLAIVCTLTQIPTWWSFIDKCALLLLKMLLKALLWRISHLEVLKCSRNNN